MQLRECMLLGAGRTHHVNAVLNAMLSVCSRTAVAQFTMRRNRYKAATTGVSDQTPAVVAECIGVVVCAFVSFHVLCGCFGSLIMPQRGAHARRSGVVANRHRVSVNQNAHLIIDFIKE